MELSHTLHLLGALLTATLGGLGLLRPTAAARLIGLEPTGRLGRSELRATYGGLFFALGAAGARVADASLVAGADRRVWRAALFDAGVATLLLAPV